MNLATTIALVSSSTAPKAFGTGFVIYQDENFSYLVTCAHVLRDIEAKQTDATRILVNSLAAEIVTRGEVDAIDLAVLRVPRLFDREPLPLGRFEFGTGEGTAIRVAGQCSREVKSARIAEWLDGRLRREVALTSQQHSVRGWRIAFQGNDRVQPGYSGGPVFVSDRVVAVAAIQLDKEGQEAIAISLDALEAIWSSSDLTFATVAGTPATEEPAGDRMPDATPTAPTTVVNSTGDRDQRNSLNLNDSSTLNLDSLTQTFGAGGFSLGSPTPSPAKPASGEWNGKRKKQLRNAIVAEYPDFGALERFVMDELDERLDTIANERNPISACFKLIEWAQAKGRIDELAEAFRAENPDCVAF